MCDGSFVCVYGSFFIPVILEHVDEYLNFKARISSFSGDACADFQGEDEVVVVIALT